LLPPVDSGNGYRSAVAELSDRLRACVGELLHTRIRSILSLSLSFPWPGSAVAPVCKAKEVTVIGASLEESVRVRCEVDADPGEVDFVWEFNNSGENFEVAPTKFDGDNGTMSELVYTPESERDYGALTCWGRNAIGKQEVPCIYQVIPAGDTRKLEIFVCRREPPLLFHSRVAPEVLPGRPPFPRFLAKKGRDVFIRENTQTPYLRSRLSCTANVFRRSYFRCSLRESG